MLRVHKWATSMEELTVEMDRALSDCCLVIMVRQRKEQLTGIGSAAIKVDGERVLSTSSPVKDNYCGLGSSLEWRRNGEAKSSRKGNNACEDHFEGNGNLKRECELNSYWSEGDVDDKMV